MQKVDVVIIVKTVNVGAGMIIVTVITVAIGIKLNFFSRRMSLTSALNVAWYGMLHLHILVLQIACEILAAKDNYVHYHVHYQLITGNANNF